MTEPQDPTRWSEAASDAPAELRDWLNAAREDLPGPTALSALGLATPPLPPPAPPLTGPEAGAAAAGASAATLGAVKVLAVITIVAGGATFFALSTEPTAPVKPNPAVTVTESAVVDATLPAVPLVVPSAEAPSPTSVASVVPSAVTAPLAPAGNVSEVQLLRQARGALAQQPQRALDLVRRHQREFPSSNYEQEREVIRIEALRRLGKTEEADRLGKAFERKFPDSAHKNRLDRGTP